MNLTDEQIQQRFEALWPDFTQQVRRSFGGRDLIVCGGGDLKMWPGHVGVTSARGSAATLHMGNNVYWSGGVAMTAAELRAIAAQAIAASIEIDANTEGK